MPRTSISSGKTEALVTGDAGDTFYVFVDNGTVRVGKHERTARLGRTLESGERAELTARQDGETLFVNAVGDDATVTVERQGWGISLFSREIVLRPKDDAVASKQTDQTTGTANIGPDSNGTVFNFTANEDLALEQAAWHARDPFSVAQDVAIRVQVIDSGTPVYNSFANVGAQSSLNLDPGAVVDSGTSIEMTAWNENSSNGVTVHGTFLYRPL
jgi:hypothetical protein